MIETVKAVLGRTPYQINKEREERREVTTTLIVIAKNTGMMVAHSGNLYSFFKSCIKLY